MAPVPQADPAVSKPSLDDPRLSDTFHAHKLRVRDDHDLETEAVIRGLLAEQVEHLIDAMARRLNREGYDLLRASVGFRMLHPQIDSRAITWVRAEGVTIAAFGRDHDEEAAAEFNRSPFAFMVDHNLGGMRRRLTGPDARLDFEVLHDFAARGGTDYLIFAIPYGGLDPLRASSDYDGVLFSFVCDRPGGWTEAEAEKLGHLCWPWALALRSRILMTTGESLLGAYLGVDAGRRVLRGEVVRGEMAELNAIVWMSDLNGFTKISDGIDRTAIADMLNEYHDAVVRAVLRHRGEVLKFIGDGILGIFSLENGRPKDVLTRALNAIEAAHGAGRATTLARRAAHKPSTDARFALHAGQVIYGNVGAVNRLDFTVIGAAVNETARMLDAAKTLDVPIVLSAAIDEMVRHTADAPPLTEIATVDLRGLKRPRRLFAPKLVTDHMEPASAV